MPHKYRLKVVKGGADKMAVIARQHDTTIHAADFAVKQDGEDILGKLMKTGRRLQELLNIDQEKINKTLKDMRKEWK